MPGQCRCLILSLVLTLPLPSLSLSCDSEVKILRIAANITKFSPDRRRSLNSSHPSTSGYDYVFSGNYWNVYREIMDFNPSGLPFRGAIIGSGWNVQSSPFLAHCAMLHLISHLSRSAGLSGR
jgi:hypothetical protein